MDILLEASPGFSSPRQVSQPGKRRRVRTLVTAPPAKSAATEGRSSAELVDDLKTTGRTARFKALRTGFHGSGYFGRGRWGWAYLVGRPSRGRLVLPVGGRVQDPVGRGCRGQGDE